MNLAARGGYGRSASPTATWSADRERRRQPHAHVQPGPGRLLHLRDRRGGGRQDPAQERAGHHAVRHPRDQQDRPRASRGREPRRDARRLQDDARNQAVRLHQLQAGERRGRAGGPDPPTSSSSTSSSSPLEGVCSHGAHRPELIPYLPEPSQVPAAEPPWQKPTSRRPEVRATGPAYHPAQARSPRAALVQQALYWDEAMPNLPCVAIISNAGSIVRGPLPSGDRARTRGAGPRHHAGSHQIHSMDHNYAAQTQHVRVADGAYLEFLPDPMIPHLHISGSSPAPRSPSPRPPRCCTQRSCPPGAVPRRGRAVPSTTCSRPWCAAEREDGRELFVEKFVVEPFRARCAARCARAVRRVCQRAAAHAQAHAGPHLRGAPATFEPNTQIASGATQLPTTRASSTRYSVWRPSQCRENPGLLVPGAHHGGSAAV